ncbi:MAG: ribosomal-protein-alanine N-acetyltransferase [Candidatus Latescibacterota bacterium]|jgi:ribosomal-protein-alanine N-acetyltransferase
MNRLTTDRLILSPITEIDFSDIHEMYCFYEVAKYNTIGIPKDLLETSIMLAKVMANPDKKVWMIRGKNTGVYIGEIGMTLSSAKYAKGEIYYNLHPNLWGQGFGSEALKAIVCYGFETLNLHRIEAGVAVENAKSVSVLEKARMRREGTCRKILPLEAGWMDNYMYAILNTDARDY